MGVADGEKLASIGVYSCCGQIMQNVCASKEKNAQQQCPYFMGHVIMKAALLCSLPMHLHYKGCE